MTKYRHSQLWPAGGRNGPWIPRTPEEVDAHLSERADAGWELVSATTCVVILDGNQHLAHSFFWRSDER